MIHFIALALATVGGVGRLPYAPGTWGSLIALPFCFYLNQTRPELYFGIFVTLFLFGIWSIYTIQKKQKLNDPGFIVIDELLGMMIATYGLFSWVELTVVFVLFRFFDIKKISPVKQIDQWSKTSPHSFYRATGVILDDLIAGLQAFLFFHLGRWIFTELF